MRIKSLLTRFLTGAALVAHLAVAATAKVDEGLEAGRQAYESGDYTRAIEILRRAASTDPRNAQVRLILAKTYFQIQQHDDAVENAEKAVALDPDNSICHEWLGKTYGDKADHAGWISAMSLAKKAQKELEKAVELDERNFAARQALIEFDCTAPGIVGGGEDKARPHIDKLMTMDIAEGHYAEGNCRRQKKDFTATDLEFRRSLESHPKSADLIYDIGDYAMKRGQPERLIRVADEGENVAPNDSRGKFYRAVGLILDNRESDQSERLLREYLQRALRRDNYPKPAVAHEWLGRLYENQKKMDAAIAEYQEALNLDPKRKSAQDSLKRLRNNS
jgi:tetratricopeptide (TPR) repeat protein